MLINNVELTSVEYLSASKWIYQPLQDNLPLRKVANRYRMVFDQN